MFESVARGRLPEPASLLSAEDTVLLKRMMYSRARGGPPTVVTHDMWHDDTDAILGHLRHRGLFNADEDRVKVVYHPEFVSSTNPLFGLDYDQFVRGCHLGVFPSYYEPWGYTPAECTVLGVPSVCSNLSGFGTFIQERLEDHNRRGLFVIDRRRLDDEGAIVQLTQVLLDFIGLNRRQRIALRNKTERVSDLLDWSELIAHYKTAWDLALSRAYEGLIPETR
jgi:glycogen(starch) synthase